MVHPALAGNLFLVKEHVGLFKAANEYDVYDPASGRIVLECREPDLGWLTRMLRFTDLKPQTPFDVEVRTPGGELVVRVKRGVAFLFSKVDVLDGHGRRIGGFKQKLSIGGAFDVMDEYDRALCRLQGKWTSWEFSFRADDLELARVTKKWRGIGMELLTSADNYVLEVAESVPADSAVRALILASVVCIDMVLKER